MEVTVVFRNIVPREALIALARSLVEARDWVGRASSPRLQISIRKTYAVQLTSALSREAWTVIDDEPERAVRTAFERFDRAAGATRSPVDERGSRRDSQS